MAIFALEHSKAAYRTDFTLYGMAVAALASALVWVAPKGHGAEMAGLALMGWLIWSFLEYAMHRFVLHGLEPFQGWHTQHHQRPMALISSPTLLSATLIVLLVYLPSWWLGGLWRACAITLGVVAGYLAYGVTHHATHHWRADNAWLKKRKLWHALHHHHSDKQVCYGVTSSFWDHVFGTSLDKVRARMGDKVTR